MPSAHSRRDFFRLGMRRVLGGIGEVVDRRLPTEPSGTTLLRPPGALGEPTFLATCTRCDDCVAACPKWAIRKAGPETGLGAGTPIIIPAEQACHWCEDFPCISACGEGALVRNGVRPVAIGTARIDERTCYAWRGQPCDYCLLRCPEKGQAIFADDANRPVIDGTVCVGCGICLERCPPDAISIRPRR